MEKAYFPMEVFNLSQGYGNNSYSHQNNLALDFSGEDRGIDKVHAPFTGVIKKVYQKSANETWIESLNPVLCADGKERNLVMLLAHANNVGVSVGQIIKQGEVFYQEGTAGNATGNHVHIELGEGKFSGSGWFKNASGTWQINNPIAPEKILWLKKGTEIKNTSYQGVDYLMKVEEDKKEEVITTELKVGDKVKIIGSYSSSATSTSAPNTKGIGYERYITKIYPGTNYPYQVGNQGKTDGSNTTGFAKAEALQKI